MAFCANCGSTLIEVGAACNACGAAASSASAAQPGYATVGADAAVAAPATSTPISNNIVGVLCYLLAPLSAIILLILEPYKNDRFVRFHSFQSIFFCVGWMGLLIV